MTGVKLQTMNERFRLSISILISLVLHIAVMMWIMHLMPVRERDNQALLQVFLENKARVQDRPLQLPAGTATTTLKNLQHKPAAFPILPRSIAGGHFRAPAASIRQNEIQNSMHLAELARQREVQR